jgi:hypothetical protein
MTPEQAERMTQDPTIKWLYETVAGFQHADPKPEEILKSRIERIAKCGKFNIYLIRHAHKTNAVIGTHADIKTIERAVNKTQQAPEELQLFFGLVVKLDEKPMSLSDKHEFFLEQFSACGIRECDPRERQLKTAYLMKVATTPQAVAWYYVRDLATTQNPKLARKHALTLMIQNGYIKAE